MPNGKPYDHPVTDTVLHGLHPFPRDLEKLVIEVDAMYPGVFNDLQWAPFDWEKGKYLAEARTLLQGLLENQDPAARQRLLEQYRASTKTAREED